jgi:hypothetical protein
MAKKIRKNKKAKEDEPWIDPKDFFAMFAMPKPKDSVFSKIVKLPIKRKGKR